MNIMFILITFDTSHFEMSTLNDLASENIPVICVTLDSYVPFRDISIELFRGQKHIGHVSFVLHLVAQLEITEHGFHGPDIIDALLEAKLGEHRGFVACRC